MLHSVCAEVGRRLRASLACQHKFFDPKVQAKVFASSNRTPMLEPQEAVLNISTRRKLAVHIIGTKKDTTSAEAVSNGAPSGSAPPGAAAAAAQPEDRAEADCAEVNSEGAQPSSGVDGKHGCPASTAAGHSAMDSKAGEEQDPLADVETEAALDAATMAADVLRVEDIWAFKRRQATWHTLTRV